MDSKGQNGSPYKVQVLDRTMAILHALAANGSDMSLVELTIALRLHKSTLHRLLMVLEGYRLVDRNPENGRYRLGLHLFELGSRAVAGLNVRERARQKLERLSYETNETVHLCVPDNGEMLYIDKVEPERSVRLASSVGRRISMHCSAVGKVILASMDEAKVEDILRKHGMTALTRHTITTPAALATELAQIRRHGYAVDNEENEEGVRCVAAPIRDYTGHVVAAISISGPTFRVTPEHVAALASAVTRAAEAISQDLGASAPRELIAIAK